MVAPTIAGRVDYDLEDDAYQAIPALSYSGAKVLLDCPARYRYQRDHGRPDKRAYDLGHVAHRYLLGRGADVAVVDAADWRTKAAQQARDEARAAGRVPILAHEADAARAMADAVHASPAGVLFAPGSGRAEVSLMWTDEETGVPLRARADWLRPDCIVDLKTCDNASPDACTRSAYTYHYEIQHATNTQGAAACGLGVLPMVFVFVEKAPPHLVTPIQLDPDAQQLGARRWREAIDLYWACEQSGNWPGYAADITTVHYPAHVYR